MRSLPDPYEYSYDVWAGENDKWQCSEFWWGINIDVPGPAFFLHNFAESVEARVRAGELAASAESAPEGGLTSAGRHGLHSTDLPAL